MEILYPDVVGSGGAPKRIMKPKRKGPDALPGSEDSDMPGTAILNLHVDQSPHPPTPARPAQQQQQQQRHMQAVAGRPNGGGQRPTSTTMPPRTNMGNASALTPPDETAATTRKRFMPQPSAVAQNTNTQPKRRRISAQAPTSTPNGDHHHHHNHAAASSSSSSALARPEDSVLLELLRQRASPTPRWPEQALDIFFRDFSDEDMDLQLKIAEKALADENKAMVFCKMPAAIRRHWVKRLREVHNRAL